MGTVTGMWTERGGGGRTGGRGEKIKGTHTGMNRDNRRATENGSV